MSYLAATGARVTTLKATAGNASSVGFDDDFKLTAEDLTVDVNISSGGVLSGLTTINWATSFPASGAGPAGYAIPTGGEPVYLDADRKLIRATTSDATLEVGGFVHINGALGFEKSQLELDVSGDLPADDVLHHRTRGRGGVFRVNVRVDDVSGHRHWRIVQGLEGREVGLRQQVVGLVHTRQ